MSSPATPVYRSVDALYANLPATVEDGRLKELNSRVISILNEREMEPFVQRAIDDTDFTVGAGRFSPDANNKFKVVFRGDDPDQPDPFWSLITTKGMRKMSDSVPKAMWTAPATKADDGSAVSYDQKPKIGAPAQLVAKPVQSSNGIRYTADYANIEYGAFKAIVANGAMFQFSQDLRHLFWRGDTVAYASDGSAIGLLLRVINGWDVKGAKRHRTNFKSNLPSLEGCEAMFRRLPVYAQMAKNLAWHTSPLVTSLYRQGLAARNDAVGEAAARGFVTPPLGFPWRPSINVPFTKAITMSSPTSGYQVSKARGPWLITSTASKIAIRVDAVAVDLIVDLYTSVVQPKGLTQDYVWPHEAANVLNDALLADTTNYGVLYANVARDDGDGHLAMVSPTTGTASKIDVRTVAGDCYTAVGLTTGAGGAGTGAASGGTVPNGSIMILTPTDNFVAGVVEPDQPEGTRIDARYNQDVAQVQTVMRSAVDCTFGQEDAVSYGYNILAFLTF